MAARAAVNECAIFVRRNWAIYAAYSCQATPSLAVGVPFENIPDIADVGAVNVLYGTLDPLPVPTGQAVFLYDAVSTPMLSSVAALNMPFATGDLQSGFFSLRARVPSMEDRVDFYVAFFSEALDPNSVYQITADGTLQRLADGLAPRMANTLADVDEAFFGDIDLSVLPPGTYFLYVAMAPAGAGNLAVFYLWVTSFVVPVP